MIFNNQRKQKMKNNRKENETWIDSNRKYRDESVNGGEIEMKMAEEEENGPENDIGEERKWK